MNKEILTEFRDRSKNRNFHVHVFMQKIIWYESFYHSVVSTKHYTKITRSHIINISNDSFYSRNMGKI